MATTDPSTGGPLPPDAIQRILYLTPTVHIYQIPQPAAAHKATLWSSAPPLFTARLRVIETATPSRPVTVTIVLEDPNTAELYAEAPYAHPAAVQHCVDSSRFFVVRIVGNNDGKVMKATVGLGFPERSEAFDFGVALQEAGKVLGFGEQDATAAGGKAQGKGRTAGRGKEEPKKDYSLKEGETITINLGSKGRRQKGQAQERSENGSEGGAFPLIPPPPSSVEAKATQLVDRRKSQQGIEGKTAEELGFDDGEFGEFQ